MDNLFDTIIDAVKDVKVSTAKALKDTLAAIEDKAKASAGEENLTALERLNALFDAGTFMEYGTYVKRGQNDDDFEGVICGFGAVNGKLVYAFSQDYSRTKGALSEAHAKKICDLYKLAIENGAPVVGMFDSAGALLPEGVKALAGYGKIMDVVSKASGVIPQIAVIPGVCLGSAAVIAGMFDFIIISDKKGKVGFNAPFTVKCEEAGKSDFVSKSGLAALTAENDSECIAKAIELLSYLPMNNAEGTTVIDSNDNINRSTDLSNYFNSKNACDIAKAVSDNGNYFELNSKYAQEMSVGFITLDGTVCGFVANNKAVNEGILTAEAARKASKFVTFCDSFDIPVVTCVDSKGMDISLEAESSSYASELAKLSFAYSSAKTALVTVVVGEAYGAAFTLMGSKSIGADIVLALNDSKIGAMSAERAVAFLCDGSVNKNEAIEKWNSTQGSPVAAASTGEVDDIIEDSELRQRIAAAVMMLSAKCTLAPARRHSNMPL